MHNAKRQLLWVSVGFWILLAYIVAALIWWYIALQRQNNDMAELRTATSLNASKGKIFSPHEAEDFRKRKEAQYLGEGIIFLALIMVGAFLVYRAIRTYIKLSQQQQTFMMAVTHELKTPIAVTRLQLETLQRRKVNAEQADMLIGQAIGETERLDALCNNILLASRLSGAAMVFRPEPTDMSSLINKLFKQSLRRFTNHQLHLNVQNDVMIKADDQLIEMLYNNLVENAVKYAPPKTSVDISLHVAGSKVLLKVADEGPGIAPAEKQKIFEKFYRPGNQATRTAKGTGLGLYLVKRIAELHGGRITVTDGEAGGSIFTAEFPLP